ncbi:MAG: hypothetical protein EPN48_10210 [Microbacteriaceae bacterium]|nr:MAG: hypothetical protein EPN48_10210 [Microbacteriaceae bacterium]
MSRTFSLAGLLRLRHAEQELAGADLARANARVRDNERTEQRARRALIEFGGANLGSAGTENLRAVAASRLASAVMLHELAAVQKSSAVEQAEAEAAFTVARVKSVGLEKLETRHREAVAKDELRAEQVALDEFAGMRSRKEEGRP